MRLGIDFRTTRVVVVLVDRGNFPLVTFAGYTRKFTIAHSA
jgi:Ethanolamine utilization protein EutJ (predicted chaperonin)